MARNKLQFERRRGDRRWHWTAIMNGKKVMNQAEGDGFPTLSKSKRNFTAAARFVEHAFDVVIKEGRKVTSEGKGITRKRLR